MFTGRKNTLRSERLVAVLAPPILSLITFLISFWLDPFGFGAQAPLSAVPALFLSMIVLMAGQAITTALELQKTARYSDKIYDAIKNYLHITPIGSPEEAFRYILSRLPVLREVQNTSFNLEGEMERADERFYDTPVYDDALHRIPVYTSDGLIWKDIGDQYAVDRLRSIKTSTESLSKNGKTGYSFKLINHSEPQLNFIILEYIDGAKEVIFNWDFRSPGQDPTVLISRDSNIVNMFSVHFFHLWQKASRDHDESHATRSTSTK